MIWKQPQVRIAHARTKDVLINFQNAWEERRKKYVLKDEDFSFGESIVNEIENKGFLVIPGYFKKEVDTIGKQIIDRFNNGDGTVNNEKSDHIRDRNNHQIIKNPLFTSPEITPFIFNEGIVRIATSYLKAYPAVGTLNLRRSFANNIPEEGVQFYHIDPNSPRFLKFFVYLNDVEELGHGPFTYVKGSNRTLVDGVNKIHRLNDSQVVKMYGKESITPIYAKKGDLIIADTTGLHKGTKCKTRDRFMLTINYGIHSEEFRDQNTDIRKETYDNLPQHLKYCCDYLNIK